MNNNKVDYNLLKTFYNVIQTESFTKAAALLNQPKSRVSRAISRLENQLGVELIRRTTRRTSATSIGRDFYQNISPILKNLNNELIKVCNYQKEMTGTIRLTAPQDIAQTVIAKIISGFNTKYPNIQIQSIITNELLDLTKDNIDLSFRAGSLKDSNLIQKKLMNVNFIFISSKSYLEKNGYPIRLSELNKFKFLSFKNMEQLWFKNKINVKPLLQTDSIPMLLSMVLNSDGITILPDYFCKEYLESGKIVRIFPNLKSPPETIHMLYHQSKNSSNVVKKFIEHASSFDNV
jgi:LysR family transcriptional regulator for bpeEF and oprC